MSRAVADMRVLSELALPMVKVGGAFLAMKAEDCTEEVETAANARTVLGAPDAEVPAACPENRLPFPHRARVHPAAYTVQVQMCIRDRHK